MEIIGRIIAAFVLMSASALAGLACVVLVYGVLRAAKKSSRGAYLAAGLFPPCAMAYMLICLVFSSVASGVLGTPDLVFGDIHENLQNGYVLTAINKMPECGEIQKPGDLSTGVAWVGAAQISGPDVLGKYDYTYFPRGPDQASRNYFLLDTRAGTVRDFATEEQLSTAAGTGVHLVPTGNFRGLSSLWERIAAGLFLIFLLGPPFAIGIWLLFRFAGLLRFG